MYKQERQEAESEVGIDRSEHFSTSKQGSSGGSVVREFMKYFGKDQCRATEAVQRRKIICYDWHGSISTSQHTTKVFLRHQRIGRVVIRMYDDGIRKPFAWIYVRLDAAAFDYRGYANTISNHSLRARREVQLVLQSLSHCLATTGIDLNSSIPFAIPVHHPKFTDARLRTSATGRCELAEYFPLIDCLGIRNISIPIDLRYPCEDWYMLHKKVHGDRRRRTQRRVLKEKDDALAAALMMQTTDFAKCVGLGYVSGLGCRSRSSFLKHQNGTTSLSIGPHGNPRAKCTVSARATNVYDKSVCIKSNPRRHASKHHVQYADLRLKKYDQIIRHDGQLGRPLLKELGFPDLECMLDIKLGVLARETFSPMSVCIGSLAKLRHALAEPRRNEGLRLQADEAKAFLRLVKLVMRYYIALANACGVQVDESLLPNPTVLQRQCNGKRVRTKDLVGYVDERFRELANAIRCTPITYPPLTQDMKQVRSPEALPLSR
ncbi:MAG: hypothetical protein KDB68_04975 [Planctomycetes bacterium]|nr:hypothetical protein [Planctomycetota bacterium]